MQYLGGKNKISKEIGLILNSVDCDGVWEPFCGGAWITKELTHDNVLATDINPYLIQMYTALQSDWIPPEVVTKDEWQSIKDNIEQYPKELVSFVGFGCSWGARWFQGYAYNSRKDNYARQTKNSLLKKLPMILNVKFEVWDFNLQDKEISNHLIYCDPPYENTTKYDYNRHFDHITFWEKCRQYSERNTVIISGYNAPNDFMEIANFDINLGLRRINGETIVRQEKLFVYKN